MLKLIITQLIRNLLKRAYYFLNWFKFLITASRQSTKLGPIDFNLKITNPAGLKINQNSSINSSCFFDLSKEFESVVLGANVKVGNDCRFTTIAPTDRIQIGDDTSIHGSCQFTGEVTIGKGCLLARNIFLSSYSHNFKIAPELTIKEQDQLAKKQNLNTSKKIIIEDDVWLAWGALVMPGVRIAKGSIIGANAVVTKDTEAYGIYGGVPAKKISSRPSKS